MAQNEQKFPNISLGHQNISCVSKFPIQQQFKDDAHANK